MSEQPAQLYVNCSIPNPTQADIPAKYQINFNGPLIPDKIGRAHV